jgi:hypothetical protein
LREADLSVVSTIFGAKGARGAVGYALVAATVFVCTSSCLFIQSRAQQLLFPFSKSFKMMAA